MPKVHQVLWQEDATLCLEGRIVSVSASAVHGFAKCQRDSITLLAGIGVEGDAHAGTTTQHRYLMKKDLSRKNLTQVHLMHSEVFQELARAGLSVSAGEMGENVTTRGIDLLGLPVASKLILGESTVVEVTGLRDPCSQLNGLHAGLMKALISKDKAGRIVRKAGIMGVVLAGGVVRAGDMICVELPPRPWTRMDPV